MHPLSTVFWSLVKGYGCQLSERAIGKGWKERLCKECNGWNVWGPCLDIWLKIFCISNLQSWKNKVPKYFLYFLGPRIVSFFVIFPKPFCLISYLIHNSYFNPLSSVKTWFPPGVGKYVIISQYLKILHCELEFQCL